MEIDIEMELCPPGWSLSALSTSHGGWGGRRRGGAERWGGAGAGQFLHPKIQSSQDVPIPAQKVTEWFLGTSENALTTCGGMRKWYDYALTSQTSHLEV